LDCQARNLSPSTLHNYSPPLTTLVRFLREQDITTVKAITADHLRTFFAQLQHNHNTGGVYGHYRVIKTFPRFMKAEGDIIANPLDRIRSPRMPQEILEPVALDVIGKLLDARTGDTKERDRAILFCSTQGCAPTISLS
jgi:site-specific recombinase XerD